jgi:MFS family permease
VVALVVLLESVSTVARPAFMVQLVRSVEAEERGAINALNGIVVTVAQFVGSLIGAVILRTLGAQPVFLLNGLIFLAIALFVLRMGRFWRTADRPPAATEDATAAAEPLIGYAEMVRRTDVLVFCVLTLSISMLIQAATALFEVKGREFSMEEGGSGLFFAAVAVGFLVGGAVAGAGAHEGPATIYLIGGAEVVSALGLVAFGMAGGLAVAVVALVVTGIAAELAEVPALTYYQSRLPSATYGRFFSLFLIASAAGGLAGALLGPILYHQMGEARALQLILLPVLAAAALLVLVGRPAKAPARRRLRKIPRRVSGD